MIRMRRLLPLVLVLGLAVRLWGIGFGLPFVNARPDETQIAGAAVGFLTGNLRPPLLEWPTLFPYTVALVYIAYFVLTRPFAAYATLAAFAESRRGNLNPFLYVPRGLSAVMGVVTVWSVVAREDSSTAVDRSSTGCRSCAICPRGALWPSASRSYRDRDRE